MKIIEKNFEILHKIIFEIFCETLKSLSTKNSIVIGLSGGSSIDGLYNMISNNANNIPKSVRKKIKFVFLDERLVPLENIDSNYKTLYSKLFINLIEKNIISQDQIIKINLSKNDIAKDYGEKVTIIDIGLFGVGQDGHTCSLFPRHQLLQNNLNGYLLINDSPKPPKERITVSLEFIKNISYCFIFFIGENKKKALNNFENNNIDIIDCPAKIVKEAKKYIVATNIINS